MIPPRWRKVLSDLWDNKARTLLVIASITIGVFAVGMIAGAYVLIPEGMNYSYTSASPANIRMVTTPFDEEYIKRIERLPGVAEVEGSRQVSVRALNQAGEWVSLDLFARQDFQNQSINLITALDGSVDPKDREVVLFAPALGDIGTEVGETITIQLEDGTLSEMTVAGSTKDLTAGLEGILNRRRGYITFNTLEWLRAPLSYNRLLIIVEGDTNQLSNIQNISESIVKTIEDDGGQVFSATNRPQNAHPLGYIVQAVLGILGLLGILIVLLSSSLIANTLNALLSQQLRQIGVMKLVGANSLQIGVMYISFIFLLGLISLIIAIPTGSAMAYWMSSQLVELINIELADTSPIPMIPLSLILQTVIALAVPVLAGVVPVRNGASTTVQEAVSGMGSQGSSTTRISRFDKLLESSLKLIPGKEGIPLIAIRNTFRRKGRLFLTLFTLALGGSIFISVFNVQISLNRKVEEITKYFTADVNLDFRRPYRIEEVSNLASTIPGVIHVEGWAATGVDLINDRGLAEDSITILAPPAASELVTPIMLAGRWVNHTDQKAIVVNEAFYDVRPGLQPGETLRIKINGREEDWYVTGIFQYAGLDRLFAYATYESLSKELNLLNRASVFRIVTEEHDIEYQKILTAQVDELFRTQGFQVATAEAGQTFTATITELLGVLTIVLLILAMMTAAVGSIGLTGTLSMNVLERTREIGIMRAVGAYDRVVIQLVIIEGLIIGIFSYLLAVALSFPITALLSDIISQAMFNSPANFAFTANGFVIWLGAVLLLSALASIVPARSAARMTIREVLAYE